MANVLRFFFVGDETLVKRLFCVNYIENISFPIFVDQKKNDFQFCGNSNLYGAEWLKLAPMTIYSFSAWNGQNMSSSNFTSLI